MPHDLIYMWNKRKPNKQETENTLIDTEKRLVAARGGGWAKHMKGVERYKLPVIQ